MELQSLVGRIFLFALCLAGCGSVTAATFNIANGDIAALKAAITAANGNGQADIINLAPAGTYTLTAIDNSANGANGLPVIKNDAAGLDLTINGNGAIIQRSATAGTPEFRILQIADAAEVNCSDLTITRGKAGGDFPADAGGGIFVGHAMLALTNCSLADNVGGLGGAIYNDGGSLNLRRTVFEKNIADAGPNGTGVAVGGAIANIDGALLLVDSTVHANRSDSLAAGIYSSGTASLTNAAVNENVASGIGGGIANDGELTLSASRVNDNRSGSVGAGIHSTNIATLRRCTINGNQSTSSGGGINNFGTLTVENCSFLNNTAGSRGGAISSFRNDPAVPSEATVKSCVFRNNFGVRGGALSNFAATLTLLNSTVSGNTAFVFGGAIHNINGIATVRAVTFTGNSAREDNAGIFNQSIPAQPGPSASLTMENTILQLGQTGVNLLNAGGTIISEGFNLSDDPAGGDFKSGPGGFLNGPKDIRNVDPRLGPLQDNGGPTLTHALLADSPAVNAGTATGVPAFDQRGFERVGAHDIGAFEFSGIELRITIIARSGNDIIVSFVTAANVPVRLQRNLGFADADWQSIPGVNDLTPATNGISQIIDPGGALLGHAFYRVELVAP